MAALKEVQHTEDWEWPRRQRFHEDMAEQVRNTVAEYDAAERRADKTQDQKDFWAAMLILVPSVLMIGLGVTKAVEIVAGWIA